VELPGEVFAFGFLGADEELREAAHFAFGDFEAAVLDFGAGFDEVEAEAGAECDDNANGHGEPEAPAEEAAELELLGGDLGALEGDVLVIKSFDVAGEIEDGVAAGENVAAKEGGTEVELLAGSPVEEGFKGFPVVVEVGLKTGNAFALGGAGGGMEFFEGMAGGFAEADKAIARGGAGEMRVIEEIVADEDAGEVNVGAETLELHGHIAMDGVHLVELDVDITGFAADGLTGDENEQE
jgi:hypothetical protein